MTWVEDLFNRQYLCAFSSWTISSHGDVPSVRSCSNIRRGAQQIRIIAPRSRILFLSENNCPDIMRKALRVGGHGYVVKSDAASDLVPALEAVMANKQFVGRRFRPQDLLNSD
jgi:DNA-binding NarL/FixJ family response regulator